MIDMSFNYGNSLFIGFDITTGKVDNDETLQNDSSVSNVGRDFVDSSVCASGRDSMDSSVSAVGRDTMDSSVSAVGRDSMDSSISAMGRDSMDSSVSAVGRDSVDSSATVDADSTRNTAELMPMERSSLDATFDLNHRRAADEPEVMEE